MNILSVKAGTNTPCGGDAGHGGILVFKLTNVGATVWKVRCTDQLGRYVEIEEPRELSVELYGDSEAESFVEAIQFAAPALGDQRHLKEGRAIKQNIRNQRFFDMTSVAVNRKTVQT